MKQMPFRPSPAVAFALLTTLAVAAALVGPGRAAPPAASESEFEAKVRPVLAVQCYSCHGADAQMGGLRLDTADGLRKTLTPGDPAKSRLMQVLLYADKVKMPPSGKRPDTEIAAVAQWIKAGAIYPTAKAGWKGQNGPKPHWAFQPVTQSPIPKIPGASPIDAFLLRALRQKGLTFAPPADKRTLLRRATLDLTGLVPTTGEMTAFLADTSPTAYEKAVDRLLASPRFGERWARHWLDVARYADSNGLDENIAFGNAWRYRDYIVQSLNQDTPYNTFLLEQLAGDLMDSGKDDDLAARRLTATGFLSLGPKVLAEPDKPKMVMDIVDEQIDVTTKATLGLTVSCARCHDHKFDPIPTRDYYALAGIFRSTKTMKTLNTVAQVNQRTLSTKAFVAAQAAHRDLLQPLELALSAAREKGNQTLAAALVSNADKYRAASWELVHTPGVLLTGGDAAARLPGVVSVAAVDYVRGNAVRDKSRYATAQMPVIITDTPPVSAEWDVTVPSAGWYRLEVRYAAEESRPTRLSVNNKEVRNDATPSVTGKWNLDGQRWEAQGIYEFAAGVNHVKIERTDGPIPHLSRLLFAPVVAPVGSPSPENTASLAAKIARRDGLVGPVLLRWAVRIGSAANFDEVTRETSDGAVVRELCTVPEGAETFYTPADKAAFDKAKADRDALAKQMPMAPTVIAVEEGTPEDVRVHLRGDTQTLGDVAPRGFLSIVREAAPPLLDPKTSGRLALAQWIVAPDNPLTARVQVNRVWEHLFGEGLVRTPDNFGLRGETPTDPALLDYLASTFVHSDNWSQKKLIRRLMLSRAYRQASTASSAQTLLASTRDADNRLWWRQNRRRLEAEPLRDNLLWVAGQLDLTLGGSTFQGKDGDYVTNDQSADKALYDTRRRSLYLPVIRNSLYDMFQVFDFGDGSTTLAHRASTTVAPQSLWALNSPLVRTEASAWADRLQKDEATDTKRVARAYNEALSRPATTAEVARATAFLARYDAALLPVETDAVKRRARAWAALCQVLLCSNEFMYVN